MMRLSQVLLLCLVAVQCQGCFASEKCSPAAQAFVQLPLREQLAEFNSHSVPEQYDIYLCGTQVVHPPLIHLAQPFAKDGKAAVGFLQGSLAKANDDATIRDIVVVFAEMQKRRTYDVAMDAALMQTIQASVSRMKDAGWRQFVAQRVNEITGSSE
jgi:hypothetical protein